MSSVADTTTRVAPKNAYEVFEITMENGEFFKQLIDFITVCVSTNSSCWLKFDNDGIKVEYSTKRQDNVSCFISLKLDRCYFSEYQLQKVVEIMIDAKKLQRLCRNVKKCDMLILLFIDMPNSAPKFLMKSKSIQHNKIEVKDVPIEQYYEKNDKIMLKHPENFKQLPYCLSTTSMSQLKKGIGGKREVVTMTLYEDKLLRFHSLSYGISPTITTFRSEHYKEHSELDIIDLMANVSIDGSMHTKPILPPEYTNIVVSGNIIAIMSKLSSFCSHLLFYERDPKYVTADQSSSQHSYTLIKVHCIIDKPQYLGEISLYIYNSEDVESSS